MEVHHCQQCGAEGPRDAQVLALILDKGALP